MKRSLSLGLVLLVIVSVVSNCKYWPKTRSQLEIREIQTRRFQTTEKKKVMQAVIEALLDEGYHLEETNTELGLINGEKSETVFDDQRIYKLTAQVRSLKKSIRVRLNIQRTDVSIEDYSPDDSDQSHPIKQKETDQITNPETYQDLFLKIEKSLFIEREVHENAEKEP